MYDVNFLVPIHSDYTVFERLSSLVAHFPRETSPRPALWKARSEIHEDQEWTHAALRIEVDADTSAEALSKASEMFRIAHERTGMNSPDDFEAWVGSPKGLRDEPT